MEDKTLLPALIEHNKQFEEIKEMLNKLSELPKPNMDNPNDNPLYIDFRKIDAFLTLQNAYYNMFAQQKISLEYVPYVVISKSIKWVEKNYKKDLKKQVDKKCKKLIKSEKQFKRKQKISQFFKRLLSLLLAPFKFIFNGIKKFVKLFTKKHKTNCTKAQSKTSLPDITQKQDVSVKPDNIISAKEEQSPEQSL